MGVAGIALSLVLLMVLAYRGVSMIVLAPLAALVAACCDPHAPLLASYTQIFMPALGRFIAAYFPLFLLGAIFGRLMEESGSSAAIADAVAGLLGPRHAVWAIVIATAVLTYAGVSVFVVVFAVYPLAAALFREAGIPKRFLPGTIACGSFTFAMTALPGSVQMHNLIPMRYFGTGPFAAPLPGLLGAAVMLHRVASLACCGLDTLPHNGAVITLLLVCGLTHRESYADIFVTSVVAPLVATAAVVAVGGALV